MALSLLAAGAARAVLSRSACRYSVGMYCELFRPLGWDHQIILSLPEAPGRAAQPGRTVRLILNRGPGPDFSERDRALLALLRPHLHVPSRTAAVTRAFPDLAAG